jgi:autotransporter-associated beta strand protein
MRRSCIFGRDYILLVLFLLQISFGSVSPAIAGFDSGIGARTVTHDGGFGGTPMSFYNEVDFSAPWYPPLIGPADMPEQAFPSIQVTNTITSGNNFSTGWAGISQWHTFNTASFFVAPGTGIWQWAPDGGNSAASLKIDFWTGFNPGQDETSLNGWYNFPLYGHVSDGGYVEFLMDITMLGRVVTPAPGYTYFSHTFHVDWTNTTPGNFYQQLSDIEPLGKLLHANENDFEIYGTIEFRAKNDTGPASIVAPEGLGFGSGSNAAGSDVADTRWTGASSGNWLDAGNWTSVVPAAGSIIEFDAAAPANQPVLQNIASPLSLKAILFAPNAATHYLGGQMIQLSGSNPVVESASSANQFINNPLELTTYTTFTVSGSGTLSLGGEISGGGMLMKRGSGTIVLANNATYGGDTVIEEGVLALDTTGQIVNSTINNNATFQILSGDHTVGAIMGSGTTEVDSGSLTASSICQDSLILAPGARVTIAPIPGGPLGGSLTPVPEPTSIGLLAAGFLAMLSFKTCRLQWK